jgi:uncharacterized membrane protein
MKLHFSAIGLVVLIVGCAAPDQGGETRLPGRNVLSEAQLRAASAGKVSFSDHVKPILEAKCAMCHNAVAQPGRMSLANQAEAIQTGTLGAWIIPGKPEQSRFIHQLESAHAEVKAMPPVGEALTHEERLLLRRWIAQGAFWPAGKMGRLITMP